jgi:hypothetical protein
MLTIYTFAAVLVNTTLFILFGKDGSNAYAITMLAYNVTDISNIHQIDYYYSGAINTNITLGQPSPLASSTPLPDIKSLSAGAKAGIAVGSIVGVSLLFLKNSILLLILLSSGSSNL